MPGYSVQLPSSDYIREDHVLPIVRLTKVSLSNFKCVNHGDVIFNCGKKRIPADTSPDILGVYGQNGSGKTSLIEAISILKYALMGRKIPEDYCRCIGKKNDVAKLEFTFDFQYPEPEEKTRTIVYSFKLSATENTINEDDNEFEVRHKRKNPQKVVIYDERISATGEFDGGMQKLQPIITTTESAGFIFGPSRKVSEYIGSNRENALVDLMIAKKESLNDSRSFIFFDKTLELFNDKGAYTEYYQVLLELNRFGRYYLYVIDKRQSSSSSMFIPFNTRSGIITFNVKNPSIMEKRIFESLLRYASSLNVVLSHIIPGMELEFHESKEGINELPSVNGRPDKRELVAVMPYSKRDDISIPLHYESEGIIKLVGILSLLISAFNDRSCTVAIDELDAGIYEFLLGEILDIFQDYGRGQLIFTSHNLRPLEVLRKEFLLFTTTNEDKRYVTMKGVGRTNNLRNLYLNEIMNCGQEGEFYSPTKKYRIVAAFQKAGADNGEK